MTLQQDQERLAEAIRDLGFEVLATLGLVRLCQRLGLTLQPWAARRARG